MLGLLFGVGLIGFDHRQKFRNHDKKITLPRLRYCDTFTNLDWRKEQNYKYKSLRILWVDDSITSSVAKTCVTV